ncbi:sarcolemmal membrane-associated protein isoform X4 [Lingula anatina]|uniref:Sarcolemmal membrane-associated protein n=1 Tax=Lingula anatina TaxID=7574 RepID=A0A1S3J2X3_LINAN|nr:sarcolemmal membrane-associated protein isoform X4 [Lingula anatina]|eukprot:XP_013404760.1 sarcolemmal membrane-associated protein isoform X4 [Lingula anatina]
MTALAIFICRPNSHPFQERHVPLTEPVKIGRAVARARPATNNAIFDCKVLSRNHALVWYEGGKFYLQDTRSSNGTFVNSQRLSKGSEESVPWEISSGDIIQFGVDVMENSRRVTHGCIITCVTLFHPDGTEAKADSSLPTSGTSLGSQVHSQELYQLSQYLQEALHREQMLENKLATLQRLVSSTQEASESGWQALIDEDRLLSRLECLENQLHIYGKNHTEESLRQELVALQEDKSVYETTAKESLRKVLEEKLEAVRKLSDLERSYSNTEDECSHLRQLCEGAQTELQELAEKHETQLKAVAEAEQKLQEAELTHSEELEKVRQEKTDLEGKLEDMINQENTLSAKVESLQADNDFTKEQLTAMKARLESLKEQSSGIDKETDSQSVQVDIISIDKLDNESQENSKELEDLKTSAATVTVTAGVNVVDTDSSDNSDNSESETNGDFNKDDVTDGDSAEVAFVKGKLRETQEQIENYKKRLEDSENRLQESKEKVDQLQNQLEQAQFEVVQYVSKVASLEDKLRQSDIQMNQIMENTVDDLKFQLEESRKQEEQSKELSSQLQEHIEELEAELEELKSYRHEHQDQVMKLQAELAELRLLKHEHDLLMESRQDASDVDAQNDSDSDSGSIGAILEAGGTLTPNHKVNHVHQERAKTPEEYEREIEKLQEDHSDTQVSLDSVSCKVVLLKELLSEARDAQKKSNQEVDRLKRELEAAQSEGKKSKEEAAGLRSQLQEMKQTAKTSEDRVADLQDKFNEAEAALKEVNIQILALREQLLAAQQAAKQSHNEAEQLKGKVSELEGELECSRSLLDDIKGKDKETVNEKLASKNRAEFASLKEECANLRRRIQVIEGDMKVTRKENAQISQDYSKLQEQYKELEAMKDKLENKEITWKLNLTDAQKEAEQTKLELTEANKEIAQLKERCAQFSEEISQLKEELVDMTEEYQLLADRSKMLSVCSMVPLLMLLFAILVSLYPTLAEITATTS